MTAKTDAERQAEYRERQRKGRISITISIDHVSVVEALIAKGSLDRKQYDDKRAIRRALEGATIIIV